MLLEHSETKAMENTSAVKGHSKRIKKLETEVEAVKRGYSGW